ncbi:Arylsulfotransferase [Akanthomyces lecanii RCEF 1005]|uniref:Arylsulfotransferase n=1 Tax=Akanthomyces lecanii RCEF 1005 TaxID=1081108 RepID=A0A162N5N5_CORDF|nr:Arylsulfotransferase [Akanthomyces lecanii RCEF 1005]
MKLSPVSLLLSGLAFAGADFTYKSRPDLAPLKLNITIPCPGSSCSDGYIFISPFTGESPAPKSLQEKPIQPGNYILTSSGDLVWSGFGYYSGWNANFQKGTYNGKDVLFAFEGLHDGPHAHGLGHHTILDNHYEMVRELRAGRHYISDKHEFIINDDGKSALIQIWQPVPRNLSAYGGGNDHVWIVDAIFQDAILPLLEGQAGNGVNSSVAWDYFHINSIEKGADGHYLLSGRHVSTVYKINSTDGSIIWQLGGNHSDFELGNDVKFGYQHHARYMPGTNETFTHLSLFDNSFYGSEATGNGSNITTYSYSRGKYITIDHEAKKASLVQAFHPPSNAILTTSQGSLQTLANGNVFINWGSEGQITEYLPNGTIIFHAHLDSGELTEHVQSYRGFRYHWTGFSPETPALIAERTGNQVQLHVSWNGDTRAKYWRFLWDVQSANSKELRKNQHVAEKTGFETGLSITLVSESDAVSNIRAIALDADGREIGSSETVALIAAP